MGRDSSVGIAARYGLEGPGIESLWGRDFPHLSKPALIPTQPLYIGYSVLPGGKSAAASRWPLTPSSAEVKERVELCLYSFSGPSWPVPPLHFISKMWYIFDMVSQCSPPKCELAPCDYLVIRISPAVPFWDMGQSSVFGLVSRLRNAGSEKLWFDSWEGKDFSLLHNDQMVRDVQQPCIQQVQGALTPKIRRSRYEAEYSS
jgi:hypothetical protein